MPTPEEILAQQASIARSTQQFKSTINSASPPLSAQSANFDASVGMHRITLSDGSIVYSDSLTNGTIADGDEVLLLRSEGIPHIDAPPHIRFVPSPLQKILPSEIKGSLAILFSKQNSYETREIEVVRPATRYIRIAYSATHPGQLPWVEAQGDYRHIYQPGLPEDMIPYPGGEVPEYTYYTFYPKVYTQAYYHQSLFLLHNQTYQEGGSWNEYFLDSWVYTSRGWVGVKQFDIELNLDVGGEPPPYPDCRVENEPLLDNYPEQQQGAFYGASWGVVEDVTYPRQEQEVIRNRYETEFWVGGFLSPPRKLITIPQEELRNGVEAHISYFDGKAVVKIKYDSDESGGGPR